LPELNDDFAREVGESDSLRELKKKIEENLTRMKESIEKVKMEDQAMDYLLKETSFEVPNILIEKEERELIKESKNDNLDDKAKEELHKRAEKRVRSFFILDEIIKKENIQALEEDVEKKLLDIAAVNFSGNLAQAREIYKDRIEDLKYQIQQEKVFKILVSKGKVEDKKNK
jgi:trigger factor